MSTFIKPTVSNIISLWFGVDTPLRRYRIQHNPVLWSACQHTSQTFTFATRTKYTKRYQSADKVAFATAVQHELERSQSLQRNGGLRVVYSAEKNLYPLFDTPPPIDTEQKMQKGGIWGLLKKELAGFSVLNISNSHLKGFF